MSEYYFHFLSQAAHTDCTPNILHCRLSKQHRYALAHKRLKQCAGLLNEGQVILDEESTLANSAGTKISATRSLDRVILMPLPIVTKAITWT